MLILALAVTLALLIGYLVGDKLATRKAERVILAIQADLLKRVDGAQSEINALVDKLIGMQKLGFVAIPEEEGESFVMDDQYEVEVERRRRESQVRSISEA